jgi:hypothetical protein
MANELQQLPNPDNVPGSVKTGYQQQNINMYAIQTGLDTTEPVYDGETTITIPAGGIVEVNGVLFKVTNTVTLTKQIYNMSTWVAVKDNGNGTASFSLVTKPGVWNPAKKSCYLPDGSRTLNLVIDNGYYISYTGLKQVFSENMKGTFYKSLERGWYFAILQSGLGNGTGQNGTNANASSAGTGGNGGIAQGYSQIYAVFFSDGKTIVIKIGGSGDNGKKGQDGTYGGYDSNNGGGAGGGGSGSGEATEIIGIAKTSTANGGRGGNGGYNGSGGRAAGGYGTPNGDGDFTGGGGVQGINGEGRADYLTPGGYCAIYKLEN